MSYSFSFLLIDRSACVALPLPRARTGRKLGRGKTLKLRTGNEITLIPRGRNREHVSYILYVHDDAEEEQTPPEGTVTFVFTDVESSTRCVFLRVRATLRRG